MIGSRLKLLLGSAAAGVLSVTLAPTPPAADPADAAPCPANQALSDLVASSEQILVGSMDVSRDQLSAQAPQWVDIPIGDVSIIKGNLAAGTTVRFFTDDAPYKASNASVRCQADGPFSS
jgi:hypothetical protein